MKRGGRIAFLLSGTGSTLENLLQVIDAGGFPGEVVVVGADRSDAPGLAHARKRSIPVLVVERKSYRTREAFSHALEEALRPHAPDVVALGGFLSVFRIPSDLKGRIVNVHPSLLPAHGGMGFFGRHVHEAVLEAGDKTTGCTVHLVTDDVDMGPVLAQKRVRVRPDDTPDALAERVQAAERALYPEVLAAFIRGDLP